MHGKARSYFCLGKDGGGCGCSFVFCPEAAISYSRVVKTATKAKKGTGENAAHAREAANAKRAEGEPAKAKMAAG